MGQVHCDGSVRYEPVEGPRFVLAVPCCGLKGGRADWLIEKATELGAESVMPLVSSRSKVTLRPVFIFKECTHE